MTRSAEGRYGAMPSAELVAPQRRLSRRVLEYLLALPLLLVAGVVPAGAQATRFSVAGGAAHVMTQWTDATGGLRAEGVLGGIAGTLDLGALRLLVDYEEGRLHAGTRDLSLAVAGAGLALRIVPGVELRTGPSARLLRTDGTAVRWVQWSVGLRAAHRVPTSPFTTYVQGWASRAARDDGAARGLAMGGLGGVQWDFGTTALRLEYALDELRAPARERFTVERVALALVLSY